MSELLNVPWSFKQCEDGFWYNRLKSHKIRSDVYIQYFQRTHTSPYDTTEHPHIVAHVCNRGECNCVKDNKYVQVYIGPYDYTAKRRFRRYFTAQGASPDYPGDFRIRICAGQYWDDLYDGVNKWMKERGHWYSFFKESICECGAEKSNTSHSDWCPKHA